MTKTEKIVSLYQRGLSVNQITEKIETSRATVYRAVKAAGLVTRGRGRPGCEVKLPAKAMKFREEYRRLGSSIASAAKRAGLPYHVGRYIATKDKKAQAAMNPVPQFDGDPR